MDDLKKKGRDLSININKSVIVSWLYGEILIM